MGKKSVRSGIAFEKTIQELYKSIGKKNVIHNTTYTIDDTKHVRTQIDIEYGKRKKYYVECKYRQKGQQVSFSEVATFAAKLTLMDKKYKQGIMVTNTTYEQRAKTYAEKINMTLQDIHDLKRLEQKRKTPLRRLLSRTQESTLEERINTYRKNML